MLEVQDQVQASFWGPTLCLAEGCLLTMSSRGPSSVHALRPNLLFIYLFIYLFINYPRSRTFFFIAFRKRGGEREGEKHWCERETSTWLPPGMHPQPGIKSDWELNHDLLVYRITLQPTKPHQLRPLFYFLE